MTQHVDWFMAMESFQELLSFPRARNETKHIKVFLQVQSWQKISEKTLRLLSFLAKQNYFFAFPTTVGYCLAVKHLKTSPSSSTITLFFCIMELLG